MSLSLHNLFAVYQSGLGTKHNTETTIIKVVNDVKINSAANKFVISVLLDLVVAFDTVDHDILLRLENSAGISGCVICWLSSYLTGQIFSVSLVNFKSSISLEGSHKIHPGPLQFNAATWFHYTEVQSFLPFIC